MNSIYESKKIADNLWQINDVNSKVSMYLIEGNEKHF